MSTMTARYSGRCTACGGSITAGEQIDYAAATKARHVACSTATGQVVTVSRPAPRAGGRDAGRRYGWDGVRGSKSYYSSGQYDEES